MSSLTWRQLKSLDLQGIRDAADGWGEVSSRASSARDRVNNEMSAKLAQQKGESKKAADERLKVLRVNYQYICTESGLVRTALDGLAGELQAQQRKLTAALDEAETRRFAVHDDGSVSYPVAGQESGGRKPQPGTVYGHPGPFSGAIGVRKRSNPPIPELGPLAGTPDPNPNRQPAQDIADRIAQAVKAACAIDDEYTTTIRALRTQPGLQVSDSMWADAAADANALRKAAGDYVRADTIPADKSPAERKKWWDGLTAEQRQAYLAMYPKEVGNLDGVPADARDEANRSYLPQLMSRLQQSDDPDAKTKLDGLQAIENRLNQGQQPPMYLLGIGDQGNGRAIISFGNPDTARHVSSYVPGLGTNLDKDFAKGTVDRAQQTAIGAQKYDPSSASIVWLGYDAPLLEEGVTVSSPAHAEAGAPAYNRFMDGIRATNQNADPHITAIGHSYGSLTVGTAAQQPGGIPGADDIVLLGSPGVGADHAGELGVGQDHVYVGASDNDPVSMAPSFGEAAGGAIGRWIAGAPGAVWGAELGDIGDDDNWYGTDPASEAFGGRRFVVADGPRPLVDEIDMNAHANYFNPQKDPESADNIARVVAGLGHTVSPEQHR